MVRAKGEAWMSGRLPVEAAERSWISWSMSVVMVGVMLLVLDL